MPKIPHECLHNYSFLRSEVVVTAVMNGLSRNTPWSLDVICYIYCCKAFGALHWDFTLKHSCKLLTLLEVSQEDMRAFLLNFFSFFKHGNSHATMIICRWNACIGWGTTVSWKNSENKIFHYRSHIWKNPNLYLSVGKKENNIIQMQQSVLKKK